MTLPLQTTLSPHPILSITRFNRPSTPPSSSFPIHPQHTWTWTGIALGVNGVS
eukprot:CAMPEP_0185441876 /NCGR_PEP_ID=MMETSP1365-20130426/43430_1 /TAXON_ID=38817 /ORGANISM="Gephyrocapsa oceanica, Strain RCC1303" /LENGTH=52 /DNA_ID=CAMNT_0028047371 /DNA_START=97 /DNA_END=252 /DNA_ORIENTATION=+